MKDEQSSPSPHKRKTYLLRHPTSSLPLATWLLGLPGLLLLPPGLWMMLADTSSLHPLLDGPWAGIALVVSAVALIGSAGFPLALQRLADRDLATSAERQDQARPEQLHGASSHASNRPAQHDTPQ